MNITHLDADWPRFKEVLAEAHELDAAARKNFLDAACGSDARLRRRIETCLPDAGADDDFLSPPQLGAIDRLAGCGPDPIAPGSRVGRYAIVELIAAGGMGEVYRARRADDAFEKRVAIKIIRQNVALGSLLERFHRERQALASLDHPGITRLIDGGTTAGNRPYLVMEHVEGVAVDHHCARQRVPLRRRLELFLEICDAVQYAHRNLVVHRDLKPGNILVTQDGRVKLVDFGIARLLDSEGGAAADATVTLLQALTPEYASPEQVRGEAVTTAADVYALGVLLYELVSGRRPYCLKDVPRYEADRIVCEVEPPAPSTIIARPALLPAPGDAPPESPRRLRRLLSGDLDNIVLMALRKDPARRYSSVEQLAEDVRHYLAARPVRARRDTFRYHTMKLVQRNRPVAAGVAMALLAMMIAFAGVSTGLLRARAAEQTAIAERKAAESAHSASAETLRLFEDLLVAANPYRTGRSVSVLDLLEESEQRAMQMTQRPEVEAQVRLAIGRTYANLMMWPEAERNLRPAVNLLRSQEGTRTGDLALAEALSTLGRALTHLRQPGAVEVQREGLALRRRRLGAEHVLVAESIGNLGFALWAGADGCSWAEAERHYLDAIALHDRLGRPELHHAARITMSLGYMYMHQGRPAEAESRYLEAMDMYETLPVSEDRYESATLGCYADLLERAGRDEEAIVLLERYRSKQPPGIDGGRMQNIVLRLARLHARGGRHEAALREHAEALAMECELRAASVSPSAAAELRIAASSLREATAPDFYPALREILDLLKVDSSGNASELMMQLTAIADILHAAGQPEQSGLLRADLDALQS